MSRLKYISWVLLLAFGLILGAVIAGQAQSSPQATKKKESPRAKPVATDSRPALEPKAIELLKAMSERLAAANTVAFTAVESYESQSRQGHPLVFVSKSEVTLQRPDKLRVITLGDGRASEFYYDGKIMTAFAPAENLARRAPLKQWKAVVSSANGSQMDHKRITARAHLKSANQGGHKT